MRHASHTGMNEQKCAHEGCHCKGSEIRSDGYCSDACRDSATGAAGRCTCGHPSCR